ncbi:MAG TPA: PAS domain S-box protein [Holophagaceae bacterium]|nr:PAS domain S-box protein [Holophagaceae bacterium]
MPPSKVTPSDTTSQWAGLPAYPFLRHAHFLVVGLDDEGRITAFNEAAERATGYSEAELLGQSWFQTLVPRDRYPEVWAIFQKLGQGNLPTHFENPILTRDGTERTIAWTNQPLVVEGRALGTFSFGQDVTEQRESEGRSRAQAELVARLFDSTHFCMAYLTSEFTFLRVNRAYADVCGFPADYFPGKNHFALYPHAENEAIFRRVVETGEPFTISAKPFEFPDHPEWGTTYWDWTLTPLRDAQGTVEGLLFVLQDVTQRTRAERALEDREAYLATTLACLGDGVITVDDQGHVVDLNPAAENLTGWKGDTAKGMRLSEVITLSPGPGPGFRVLRGRDGHERKVTQTLAPLRDKEGRSRGSVVVIHDITRQAEAESALHQVQKMDALGQLAGGIAHDFNNILTGIQGFAELLTLSLPPDSPLTRHARSILEGSDHAAHLIRKLLTFSRKGSVSLAPVDLHALIRETRDLLERCIDPHIRIELCLDDAPAWMQGDASLLHTALLNLGLNARDAMPEGGRLRIATSRVTLTPHAGEAHRPPLAPGPYLEIDLSDTGLGIPPEVLPRIFEPFFTTKSPGHGTGLGLSAVYGAVSDHAGAIDVTSTVGQGTSFKVLLPLLKATPAPQPAPKEPAPLHPLRVLVIDDQEPVRSALGSLLASLGHEAVVAESGEAGLSLYACALPPFDLVLLDLVMPGLDGQATCRQLRELDPRARIYFCSGFTPERNLQDLLKLGALGLLQKPLTRARLAEVLVEAMGT